LIGRFPDLTIEQARIEAQKLNGKIADGKNPAEERRAIRAETTLRELFALYLEKYSKPHKRTWKSDVSMFHRHLESLGEDKISSITTNELADLHRKLGRRTPYAANRTLELVSSMFNWARTELKWKGENPATGVKAFKEHPRQRFLGLCTTICKSAHSTRLSEKRRIRS
jgi:hypothetical protein